MHDFKQQWKQIDWYFENVQNHAQNQNLSSGVIMRVKMIVVYLQPHPARATERIIKITLAVFWASCLAYNVEVMMLW